MTEIWSPEEILQEEARRSFRQFIEYTKPDYFFNWHHEYMIQKLDEFVSGRIKRLMIFAPPRHGKSEIVSRRLPAYILGKNPNARIIACSYSAELASAMNRDVQRIMTSDKYMDVFPNSALNSKNVVTTQGVLRNSTRFDIIGGAGYYYCAGVGGGITGLGADFAIIDDPVKNADEANSQIIRDRHWEWYTTTLYTRLEKGAGLLITLTRWHEDDLAGRLLQLMESSEYADQWEVIQLPAIKEDNSNPNDSRAIGKPLWAEKYDINRLQSIKESLGTKAWNALYQQRPAPQEGSILKRKWFKWYNPASIDFSRHFINFYLDTAYTSKEANDPSAILACFKKDNDLYILNCQTVRMEFPDLVRFIPQFCEENYYTRRSIVVIEPKASGKSVVQYLKDQTDLNIKEDEAPTDSKLTRVNVIAPTVEAGRIFLPENADWTEDFINECITFPNGKHDDRVDCLVMAINRALQKKKQKSRFVDWTTYNNSRSRQLPNSRFH